MNLAILLLTCLAASAADEPRIFYSKSFPGSTPAYVEITLNQKGRVEYREAPKDKEEDPLISQLTEEETKEIWALAAKLDWFRRPLESGLKVARMGDKTLRMENYTEKGEQKFNYTQDEEGRLIHDWFEKITETAQHRMTLDSAIRFDKLGVNKALLQFEAAMDRKRLLSLQQFLPMLDRVAKNDSYLHMARDRAAALADMIRNADKPKTP